jgi:succinate dehydrogenase/fumarate reductase flavoprotein subunit
LRAELGKSHLLSKDPLSAPESLGGGRREEPSTRTSAPPEDTLKAGRGLADENLVHALAQDAIDRIHDLESYGAKFKKNPDGSFATSLRPGQTHSRNLIIVGGIWHSASLFRRLAQLPKILLLDDVVVTKLLTQDGRVTGAVLLNVRTGEVDAVMAKATIIATGGYEELWPFTDTPPDTTGEVLVMAYQAGAHLIDLEMVPTIPALWSIRLRKSWLVNEYILNLTFWTAES